MNFSDFLFTYGLTILSGLITIGSFVYATIKSKKSGNSSGVTELFEKIPDLVTQAEAQYGSGKGAAKLDWVLSKLQIMALKNAIKVSDEALIKQINKIVDTTKKVNVAKSPSEQDIATCSDNCSDSIGAEDFVSNIKEMIENQSDSVKQEVL